MTEQKLEWVEIGNGISLRLVDDVGTSDTNLSVFWQGGVIYISYFGKCRASHVQDIESAKIELLTRLVDDTRRLTRETWRTNDL